MNTPDSHQDWVDGLKVGDEVAEMVRDLSGVIYEFGKVTKITLKKREITVDFGSFDHIYDRRGGRRTSGIPSWSQLEKPTPEMREHNEVRQLAYKVRDLVDNIQLHRHQLHKVGRQDLAELIGSLTVFDEILKAVMARSS
jgi:hypothetical protein